MAGTELCFVFTETAGWVSGWVSGWVGEAAELGQLLASSDTYTMQPSSLIFQSLPLKHFIS